MDPILNQNQNSVQPLNPLQSSNPSQSQNAPQPQTRSGIVPPVNTPSVSTPAENAVSPAAAFNLESLNFKTMPQGYKPPEIAKVKPLGNPVVPTFTAVTAAPVASSVPSASIAHQTVPLPTAQPSTMGNFGGSDPSAPHKGLSKNIWLMIIIAAVLLILATVSYWYFALRTTPPAASTAMTPVVHKTQTNSTTPSNSTTPPDTTTASPNSTTASTSAAPGTTTTNATTPSASTPVVTVQSQIPSDWQQKYFGAAVCANQDVCGDNADPDHDGLTNLQEYQAGTDPNNAASDGDGIADGDAVHVFNLNPLTDQTANNPKFTDAGDLKYKYNSKANRPFTDCDLVQIAANIKQYGLHEPTITTLGPDLVSFYTNYQSVSTTGQCLN